MGVKETQLKNIWFDYYGEIASSKLSREGSERNEIIMREKLATKQFFSRNIRFDWKKIR